MTDQEFIQICQNASSMAEAQLLTRLQFTTFKVRATNLGCYDPNKGKRNWSSNDLKIFEILDGKHPTFQPYKLKQLLFKHDIKENKCECCGISEWQGKPINCELHHKDGNKFNHSLENLIILCPNCHSQTENFRFKREKTNKLKIEKSNKLKIEKTDKSKYEKKLITSEFKLNKIKLIEQRRNIVYNCNINFSKFGWVGQLAKLFGISPQKVGTWMKKYMSDFYETCYKRKN